MTCCSNPNPRTHLRLNRDWVPPLREVHERCLNCGHQTPWRAEEPATDPA